MSKLNKKIQYISSAISLVAITGCTPKVDQHIPTIQPNACWKNEHVCQKTISSSYGPAVTAFHGQITEEHTTPFPYPIFHWWQIYADPLLNELELQALQANPSLQASLHRFQEAVAYLGVAESDLYPTLSLSANASRQRVANDLRTIIQIPVPSSAAASPNTTASASSSASTNNFSKKTVQSPKFVSNASTGFTVNYEVDLWGRVWLTKEASKALAQATRDDMQTMQLMVTYQVAQLYYTLLYYNLDLSLLNQSIISLQEQIQLYTTRYRLGINDATPCLQLEIQEKEAQSEKAALIKERERTAIALSILLGKAPQEFTLLCDETKFCPWAFVSPPVTIPSTVLETRPDIRRSLHELESLLAQIGIAKTAYLPSLSLSALLGQESTKVSHLHRWKNRIWSLGSTLGVSLLDAGAKENQVKSVQAAFEAQASEYIRTCLIALQEVETALITCSTAQEKNMYQIEREKNALQLVHLLQQQYAHGITPYQCVLTQQIDYIALTRDRLQSEFDLQLSTLDIVKAIGGTWEQQNDE